MGVKPFSCNYVIVKAVKKQNKTELKRNEIYFRLQNQMRTTYIKQGPEPQRQKMTVVKN